MCFFFFNDTATTEIYTLSLHDALPILEVAAVAVGMNPRVGMCDRVQRVSDGTERLVLHDDQVQRGGRDLLAHGGDARGGVAHQTGPVPGQGVLVPAPTGDGGGGRQGAVR